MLSVLGFTAPHVDYHALAPEIIIATTLIVVLLVDLASERNRTLLGTIAGIGLLAAMVPILTLAVDGTDRFVLSGNPSYVVDNFALTMKALFIVAGYVVILLSTNYVAEGDYYEGEYYFLLLTSVLGMVVMASSRDLISIFIALETLSIPAYMLATWRKRDPEEQRSGPEVLPDGCLRHRDHALWHVADLRRHGLDLLDRHLRQARNRHDADRHARHRVLRGGVRVQGVGGALPHVGSGHLRRARRRRSPRSCRCRPRRVASSRSCR